MFNFIYYSFETLTTLGYGDILPMTPLAKTLIILEAHRSFISRNSYWQTCSQNNHLRKKTIKKMIFNII